MNAPKPIDKQIIPARPHNPKPKRPLSAFNLFYRFKRLKVVEARSATTAVDKDKMRDLVMAAPGMEHYPAGAPSGISPDVFNAHRCDTIRTEMKMNLDPRDTKDRAHRKNEGAMNGAMSFVEMGKVMNISWKNCDDVAKSVFNDLANEGRERYRIRLDDYKSKELLHLLNSVKAPEAEAPAEKDKATGKAKKKSTKKKMSTKRTDKLAMKTKEKLPAKNKNIALKTSELPSLKRNASAIGARAMNETAEAMVQLARRHPSNNNNGPKMCSLPPKRDNNAAVAPSHTDLRGGDSLRAISADCAVSASLQDLLDEKDTANEAKAKVITAAMSSAHSSLSSPQGILPNNMIALKNEVNGRLMLRVREMERVREMDYVLAAQQLRARIQHLEGEIARRNARDRLLQIMLTNSALQRQQHTAAVPYYPPMHNDGLWNLVSQVVMEPNRVGMPRKHPYDTAIQTASQMNLTQIPEDHLNKRQRFD